MKNTRLFLLIAMVALLFPMISGAQLGWKWGVTTSNVGNAPADIIGPTVTDGSGSVFVACVQDGSDSMTFGTIKVYDPNLVNQCVVAKADSAGNFVWALGVQSKGPSQPYSIATDSKGNLYLFGYYSNDSCEIGGVKLNRIGLFTTAFLAKISPAGIVRWAVNVTESAGFGSVVVDDSDYVYVQGAFNNSPITIGTTTFTNRDKYGFTTDMYVAKYDTTGNNKWAISYGGRSTETPSPYSAYLCAPMAARGNNIYVSGQSQSDTMTIGGVALTGDPMDPTNKTKISYLAEIDNNGNVVWARKIDRHIAITGISVDNTDAIYITGGFDSNAVWGSTTLPWVAKLDVITGKLDPTGNPLWVKSTGGAQNELGYSVAVDRCGKVWTCGQEVTHETLDFDGHLLTPGTSDNDPMYIVEYDTAGNYITSMQLTSGGDDVCGLAIDNRGNFFIGGDYSEEAMTFGSKTLPLITGGEYYFIARYEYDTSGCYIHDEGGGGGGGSLNATAAGISQQSLTIYPNPATNELNIESAEQIRQITISSLVGQTVYSRDFNSRQVHVSIAGLSNGMYLVKINGREVRKFVKE